MRKLTFVNALMQFHMRVLYQGQIHPGDKLNVEKLSQKLFYNQIFISNTDEMFERYKVTDISVNRYIECMKMYNRNIRDICGRIEELEFMTESSFECKMLTHMKLRDALVTSHFTDVPPIKFVSGQLYYIGIHENCMSISVIDPRMDIYHSTITSANRVWKTEDCIMNYIKDELGATKVGVIKPSIRDGEFGKIEFKGDLDILDKLGIGDPLVLINPYIYIDDIIQAVNNINPVRTVQVQKYRPVSILELAKSDKIIEYPTESFGVYLNFLEAAVDEPETSELYLTLYRIGTDPQLYEVLKKAVEKGIKVQVNIELDARGEEINKLWAIELEKVGVKVTTYEAYNIKVHSKLTLIKFNSGRSVCQVGTGNYHTRTTAQYTDLSLLTGDESICAQAEKLFALFAGATDDVAFGPDFLVTRFNARAQLLKLIDRQANENGFICIKCNAIDDDQIIYHLSRAAKRGCHIELLIRGVCTWVPYMDNVRVKSVVWDKLEHSRIYAFGQTNPVVYMGSLDLVTRKLEKRIETMVRVRRADTVCDIVDYLNRYITTTTGSWVMKHSGSYVKESE